MNGCDGPLDQKRTNGLFRAHMPECDALRGIAILLVFVYHLAFIGVEAPPGSLPSLLYSFSRAGWIGVDLFFVLSGFLISGNLLDSIHLEPGAYYRRFFMRRMHRILPLYYLVLLAVSFILMLAKCKISLGFFLLSIVYLSNLAMIFGHQVAPSLGILWSLAIEEQFYLLWPLFLRFINRSFLLPILVAILIMQPAARALAVSVMDIRETVIYVSIWFRLDGLICGAMLALLIRSPFCTRQRFAALSVSLLACSIAVFLIAIPFGALDRRSAAGSAVQFFCAALFFGGLLGISLLVGSREHLRVTGIGPLFYIGRRSYCIYLIHVFAIQAYD